MRMRVIFPLVILFIVTCGTITIAQQSSNTSNIRPIISAAQAALANNDVRSQPVVYEDELVQSGDYAIVGWTDGPLGGTMLLKYSQQRWLFVAKDGGPIGLHPETLIDLGVPRETAIDLSSKFRTIAN